MTRNRLLGLLLASTVLGAGAARAQDVTLTVSTWVPTTHAMSQIQLDWCRDVAQVTAGRVKCNVLAKPVAPPPATFDAVRDGLADVSFSVHGYTPGRFALTKFVEFPFMGDSAEAKSARFT